MAANSHQYAGPESWTRTPLGRLVRAQGRRAEWIAQRLGVHRGTAYAWCNGREPLPPGRILQLAELLGVKPAALEYRDGDTRPARWQARKGERQGASARTE